jgi:hypothetical protein
MGGAAADNMMQSTINGIAPPPVSLGEEAQKKVTETLA